MSTLDPLPPLRVLLVDDDIRTTQRLARMLREDGYEVDIATDAARATERLEQGPTLDVVVTDILLPRTGGARLVRLARARIPTLAVFVVTSHPNLAASLERELDPPIMILTKPLVYDDLQAHLAHIAPTPPVRKSEAHGA